MCTRDTLSEYQNSHIVYFFESRSSAAFIDSRSTTAISAGASTSFCESSTSTAFFNQPRLSLVKSSLVELYFISAIVGLFSEQSSETEFSPNIKVSTSLPGFPKR